MPVFRSRSVVEIARGLKAFLVLHAGLVRGEEPDPEEDTGAAERGEVRKELRLARERLERQARELDRLKERLSRAERPEGDEEDREASYEELYKARIRATSPDVAIGSGRLSFDTIGRLEMEILKREGLKPAYTLVDLGCGTGRLAVHAIPALAGGRYVGIDISRTMLESASRRGSPTLPATSRGCTRRAPPSRWRQAASTWSAPSPSSTTWSTRTPTSTSRRPCASSAPAGASSSRALP